MDLLQPLPGHLLVVPRRHAEQIFDLSPEEAGAVMALATRVAHALRAELDAPGLTLWQSNGHAAGQDVPHVHLHLQARRPRDGLYRIYPNGLPAPSARADLDALAARLRERFHALA